MKHRIPFNTTMALLFALACILASCNYAKFQGGAAPTATLISVGAKQNVQHFDIGGSIIVEGYASDSVEGFKAALTTINKMWANYLMAEGLKYMADQYYTLEGAKVSASSAAEIEKLRNAKSVADAKAQLEILKANPIETVPLATPGTL